MARDSQRGKVYDWERVHICPLLDDPMSLEACRRLASRVFWDYELAPPRIKAGRGGNTAYWRGHEHSITLPGQWARVTWVVLHECAHGIVHCRHRLRDLGAGQPVFLEGAHGATFMRVYLDLLARYGHVKIGGPKAEARAAHIHIAPKAVAAMREPGRN